MATSHVETAARIEARYRARTPRSAELYARATASLPGGSTRTTTYFAPYPPYVEHGAGARIVDVDGNTYVDFLNNYTSLILGHAHPAVVAAVQEQVRRGSAFGAPTSIEVEHAEEIRARVPSAQEVRFTNSGTEATMLALRLARAATGRDAIGKFENAYHGTHDWALAWTTGVPRALGDLVVELPYDDIDGVEARLAGRERDLAAIIIEPVLGAGGMRPASVEFLQFLRNLSRRHGIVLIFDEIIAFRIGFHGAQGEYGVTPDLTALGKIVGGGLPLAALAGSAELMDLFDARRPDGLGHGGTFNGNPVAAAAGLATLRLMTVERFAELNDRGARLRASLGAAFASRGIEARVTGAGSLFQVHMPSREAQARVHLGMLNEGFYLAPRGLGALSLPMTDHDLDAFAATALRVAGGTG